MTSKGLSASQRGYYQMMNDIKKTTATTASILAAGSLDVDVDISEDITINKDIFLHGMDVYSSASTTFAVEVYQNTARTAKTFIARYESETIGGHIVIKDQHIKPLHYRDLDGTKLLFLKIINTDASNASTFTYSVAYGVA